MSAAVVGTAVPVQLISTQTLELFLTYQTSCCRPVKTGTCFLASINTHARLVMMAINSTASTGSSDARVTIPKPSRVLPTSNIHKQQDHQTLHTSNRLLL